MISSVHIKNFQSLEDVLLRLGKVTIIVGHSDAGKSAVFRALDHACFNLSGSEFLTNIDGAIAKHCSVEIQCPEGTLMWERSQKSVEYKLITASGTVTLNKMGRGNIPEDVSNFLGIREIIVDDKTVHKVQFSSQHDQPFLVVDRGGVAAARVLGTITGLNVFANANKLADSDRRQASRNVETSKVYAGSLRDKVREYAGVDQRLDCAKKAAVEFKDLEEDAQRLWSLQKLQNRLKLWYTAYAEVTGELDRVGEEAVAKADAELCAAASLRATYQRLVYLGATMLALSKSGAEPIDIIKQVDDADAILGFAGRDIQQHSKLDNLAYRRFLAVSELTDIENVVLSETVELGATKHQLDELVKSYPLCPWESDFSDVVGNYRCEHLNCSGCK